MRKTQIILASGNEVRPYCSFPSLAETEEERRHLEISRWSLSYVDLFCKPNRKADMTTEKRAAYDA